MAKKSLKEKYKRSIMTDDLEHCYVCGRDAVHYHHIFGAHNRDHATEDGLFIGMCLDCHIRVHNEPSQRLNYDLKRQAQLVYEQTHTHDEWFKRYGKNYL